MVGRRNAGQTPAERIGADPRDIMVDIRERNFAESERQSKVEEVDPKMVRSMRCGDLRDLFLGYYLLGHVDQSRQRGREFLAAVIDLHFGDWIESYVDYEASQRVDYSRARARKYFLWMRDHQPALACAFSLGDRDAVMQLVRYPDNDVNEERACYPDYGPVDKSYHILLAGAIAGDARARAKEHVGVVMSSQGNRHKLQWQALQAIMAGDSSTVDAALRQLLKSHHQRRRGKSSRFLPDVLALEATSLYHFANWKGLVPSNLGPHVDYLIRM
jgi:hypothetical protein